MKEGVSSEESGAPVPLEDRLGYHFGDPVLLEAALTHPSLAQDRDGTRGNERLEFLGDSALDLVISELLYAAYPEWDEGQLSRARSTLVNGPALAARAQALHLGDYMRLGRTERHAGAQKPRILANVFEAVVGALYLDGGIAAVRVLVRREFAEGLASGDAALERDAKTRFQEWTHAQYQEKPHYEIVTDTEMENAEDRFEAELQFRGECWGRGTGRTKRAAEQAAAGAALLRMEALDE